MSFEAAAWAIKQKPETPIQKLVLITLADCCNSETALCFPSMEFLADTAMCSRGSAIQAIKKLEKAGFIEVRRQLGRSNHYKLNTENQYTDCTSTAGVPVQMRAKPVQLTHEPVQHVNGGSTAGVPKPVNNQEVIISKEPIKEISTSVFNFRKSLESMGVSKNYLDDWLTVRKKKKASNTPTALEGFLNEVSKSGRSVDDIVRLCAEKSWSGFNASWLQDNKNKTFYEQTKEQQHLDSLERNKPLLEADDETLAKWGLKT